MLIPILKEWKRMEEERMKALGSAWQGERQITRQPLFIQDNGKPMYKDTPCKSFEKAVHLYNLTVEESERIPETITLHGCRHYYGSVLIANGVPVSTVSRLMGHANVSVTMEIYLHDVKPTEETRSQIDSIFREPQEETEKVPLFLG
jgi:integrase